MKRHKLMILAAAKRESRNLPPGSMHKFLKFNKELLTKTLLRDMEPSINSSNSLSDPEVQASGYKKFWVGGIPPRTQKDALKTSFIEAFDITDANIVDQIQVIIKLGYGFVTIPSKYTGSIM